MSHKVFKFFPTPNVRKCPDRISVKYDFSSAKLNISRKEKGQGQ